MSEAFIVWRGSTPIMVKASLEEAKHWAHFSPEIFQEDSVIHISGPHRSTDAVVDARDLVR